MKRPMQRRTLLGMLATGLSVALAGCSRSRVDGDVVANETPLDLTHEYTTQGTPSGTRVLVETTVENDGAEPITQEGQVPRITCTFLDDAGEQLHESGRELVQPLDVGASTDLDFSLAVDTDDVTRYELRTEWVPE